MSRRSLAALACAAVLSGVAGGAVGSPPPPPPENMDAAVDEASCGSTRQATPAVQVPAVVTPLAPESMGVRDGRLGKLTWKWGVRIAASGPRVGAVTGLELNERYGLLATTAKGLTTVFLTVDSGTPGSVDLYAFSARQDQAVR